MKTEIELSKPIEAFVHAVNAGDERTFASSFNQDAIVKDIGREIRGITAIADWARHEIFSVNVVLELMNAVAHEGQIIITLKVDGTFDRTGLPDPLVMEHCFTIVEDKIASLTCRLAPQKVS